MVMSACFERLLIVGTICYLASSTKHLFGGWVRHRKTRKLVQGSRLPSDRGTGAISNAARRQSSCRAAGADNLEATGGCVPTWWRRGGRTRPDEVQLACGGRRDGFS